MPQLIQHIPIQSDGVPNPQTLAPILSAAQPGTVTLVASNAYNDSELTQTLLTLSLELAKTQPTIFVSNQYTKREFQCRIAAAALDVTPDEVHALLKTNPQRVTEKLDAASKTAISFAIPLRPEDYNGALFPSGGACLIDVAQILAETGRSEKDSAEWMSEQAKAHNAAVIAGLYLFARSDDPNAPIPGVMKVDRLFIKNADAIFVLHDEDERRR